MNHQNNQIYELITIITYKFRVFTYKLIRPVINYICFPGTWGPERRHIFYLQIVQHFLPIYFISGANTYKFKFLATFALQISF